MYINGIECWRSSYFSSDITQILTRHVYYTHTHKNAAEFKAQEKKANKVDETKTKNEHQEEEMKNTRNICTTE